MNSEDKSENQWLREFITLISIILVLSGLAYSLQLYYFQNANLDDDHVYYDLIRMIRMLLFYVIPAIWFVNRHNGSWKDLGILPSKDYPISSIIAGILVYLIAIIVFLKYDIFYAGWDQTSTTTTIVKFFFIAVMASITDFWTRGFILFELAKRYRSYIAVLWQNIIWFVIHLYEIELLVPYIGIYYSILLTITLGIGGDLVALKTESILGLMCGHILLNLAIILSAKEIIILL
ncbi:MAG: CPBP family glutamic-type intramembrane protease [Candidatus Kariarchaeaceae archaeon]|jgi:hypothetical protein